MPIDTDLLERLQQNEPDLTTLNLSKKSLTDADITQLVQILSTNTTLTSLNIASNQIGAEGAKALSVNTTLASLDVSYNQIDAEGVKALSANTSLASLAVGGNRIGAEGAKALSTNTTLTSLNVSGNGIGDEGVKALSTNTTLTSLNVGYNEIGAEGVKALSANTSLASLAVGWNEISNEGAKALSANTTLTSLDVSWNEIGDEGAKAFTANTNLTSLNIDYNQLISRKTHQLIEQTLVANKQRQQEMRNRFILIMNKGVARAVDLASTDSLRLPAELISHLGSFLDASFYLQLATIKHPAHMGKTEQQVHQCVLFFLQQLVFRHVTEGGIIESKPKGNQALDYRQHFMFKPTPRIVSQQELQQEEPPTKKQKLF